MDPNATTTQAVGPVKGGPWLQGRGARTLHSHLVALLLACGAAALAVSPWGQEAEGQWGLHWLGRLRNLIDGDRAPGGIVIVSIDRHSLFRVPELADCALKSKGQILQQCWPRTRYGEIIDTLHQQGAALVILNVLFLSPRNGEDQALAAAMRKAGNVVLQDYLNPALTGPTTEFISAAPPPSPLAQAAAATAPLPVRDSRGELIQFWTAIPSVRMEGDENVPELRPTLPVVAVHLMALRHSYEALQELLGTHVPEAAEFLAQHRGDRTLHAVVDGLIVRLTLRFQRQPGLLLEILREVESASSRQRYLRALFQSYRGDRELFLNPYGPAQTITTIPLENLELSGPAVRDQVVVVAPSLELGRPVKGGSFATAFSEIGSGELLATAYANLLENRFIEPLPPLALAALTLAGGYLVTLLAIRLPLERGLGLLLMLALGYSWLALRQFREVTLWLPLIIPLLQAGAAALAGFACHYREQRRRIHELITIKIPGSLLPILERSDSPLAGEFVHCSGVCMVTDGAGYTALTDSREGAWLAQFMKDYQDVVERPVREHGGTVKDWAGDGMLALWWGQGPPSGRKPRLRDRLPRWRRHRSTTLERRKVDRRSHALDAAIRIQAAVARFTGDRKVRFPIRIGVNFGPMWIAYAGELKAFGDTLNTTQRLEALNKVLGTTVLVAEAAIADLNGYATRHLGSFVLPGKREPVRVYELLGYSTRLEAGTATLITQFADALERFERGDWHSAFEAFALLREDFPEDGPCQFYVKACRERIRGPEPLTADAGKG